MGIFVPSRLHNPPWTVIKQYCAANCTIADDLARIIPLYNDINHFFPGANFALLNTYGKPCNHLQLALNGNKLRLLLPLFGVFIIIRRSEMKQMTYFLLAVWRISKLRAAGIAKAFSAALIRNTQGDRFSFSAWKKPTF